MRNFVTSPKLLARQFASGAALGPVDNFHSQYGVLQYDRFDVSLLVETSLWTPPLFGVAAVLIGGIALSLDKEPRLSRPELVAPSIFVFVVIYWLSAILGPLVDPVTESLALWPLALASTLYFDASALVTAALTAVGGPLIELALTHVELYHYVRADFYGVASWIPAVYFAGAAPVALLARSFIDVDEDARGGASSSSSSQQRQRRIAQEAPTRRS